VVGDGDRIQWLERNEFRHTIFCHDVALSIVPALHALYEAAYGVIFTSATLTTLGNFSYIQTILGITSAHELILPSAFNLAENLLIYIVDDAPHPRHPTYDTYVGEYVLQLSLLLRGRTLGLFTSFRSVNTVFQQLVRALNKGSIKLLAQGHSGGKASMVRHFRDEPESVLLGTDSFWEGVDIPGDTLSAVVIAKLPFAPPHDPVTDALAETVGQHPFSSQSLPQMILKLRQGIGRLIRRQTDRGVVVIFDSRLLQSGYADDVLKSLPAGRIKIGAAADLISATEQWIGPATVARWRAKNRGVNR